MGVLVVNVPHAVAAVMIEPMVATMFVATTTKKALNSRNSLKRGSSLIRPFPDQRNSSNVTLHSKKFLQC